MAGRERDDASDLLVGSGRDPHITGNDILSGDLKGGGHQRHKLWIVAPHRLRAETEIRQRGRLLDPGEPDVKMSVASTVSQTPARRAQPTLVFRQIVAPVQPGHALGAALVEGRGECLFAGLVTTALTGKDRDRGDPARKKFRAAPLNPEHCALVRRGNPVRPRRRAPRGTSPAAFASSRWPRLSGGPCRRSAVAGSFGTMHALAAVIVVSLRFRR